jgi:hypothetical protein
MISSISLIPEASFIEAAMEKKRMIAEVFKKGIGMITADELAKLPLFALLSETQRERVSRTVACHDEMQIVASDNLTKPAQPVRLLKSGDVVGAPSGTVIDLPCYLSQ